MAPIHSIMVFLGGILLVTIGWNELWITRMTSIIYIIMNFIVMLIADLLLKSKKDAECVLDESGGENGK